MAVDPQIDRSRPDMSLPSDPPAGSLDPTPPPGASPTNPGDVPPRPRVPGGQAPTFPPDAASLIRDLKLDLTPPAYDTGILTPLPTVWPTIPGYEILGELGRGGMGVVYKARQVSLNRTVALKMILGSERVDAHGLVRFLAEAEAVAAVRHPNVVQVYDLGHHEGRPFLAMEYVDGGSLADRLRPPSPPPDGPVVGRRFAPRDAAALIESVARGVAAAHAEGIVHRDLKPGNILLAKKSEARSTKSETNPNPDTNPRPGTRQGGGPVSVIGSDSGLGLVSDFVLRISDFQPKVGDFGLAKRLGGPDGPTRTQAVVGTPAYMAPEQAGGQGKFVGPQADVYALGVILYQCLTGDVPFRDEDNWSLLRKVLEEQPPPPRKLAPGVPRDLELICLKCLEKEPHLRYPTANELADDLRRFLDGRPVTARPISTARRVWRWCRRNPAPATLAGLLLALAVVVPPLVIHNEARLATERALAGSALLSQIQAEKATRTAEELAATRELFGLENTVRRRAVAPRSVGWTRDNLRDLARAAELAAADPAARTRLRSDAAEALLEPDLRPVAPVAEGYTAAVLAPSPDGSVVAVGEFKARGHVLPCRVLLVDPVTGRTLRQLAFPVLPLRGKDGGLLPQVVQDGVKSLAFTADGKRLFVGTRASVVFGYDLDAPGEFPVIVWQAQSQSLEQLAVGADGTVYTASPLERPVIRWSGDAGHKRLGDFSPPDGVKAIALDPGSGRLFASDGRFIHRVNAATMVAENPDPAPWENQPRRLAFTPGGRVLVVGMTNQVLLADPRALRVSARVNDPDLRRAAHEGFVVSLAVHPNRPLLATASDDEDRRVKVWSLASGRRVAALSVPGTTPIQLAWGGNGRYLLATGTDQTLRWELIDPPARLSTAVLPLPLEAATFAPDGRVVSVSEDTEAPNPHTRYLAIDPPDGTPGILTTLAGKPGNGRAGVAVHPKTGRVAVTQDRAGVVFWQPGAPPGEPGLTPNIAWGPRYSPDGSALWAVVDSSRVQAWDADTGAPRHGWSNDLQVVVSGLAGLEALAVGRTRVAAGGRNGTVYLLTDKAEWSAGFPGPGDPVLSVTLPPDDSAVVAGTQNGRIRVVRPGAKEQAIPDAHPGGVTAVAVSKDGSYLASGGKDRAVRVWRPTAEGGFELVFAVADLASGVRGLEFGRADNRLLVVLTNEHAARVWDLDVLRRQLGELNLGW
jgi:serine/threonine protein kinase/WD40 repeat protein